MTDKHLQDQAASGNMKKDPDDWVTGDEPMTGAQQSYLKTLSEEAGQAFDGRLSKAQASRRIEELQALTGRRPPPAGDAADEGAPPGAEDGSADVGAR